MLIEIRDAFFGDPSEDVDVVSGDALAAADLIASGARTGKVAEVASGFADDSVSVSVRYAQGGTRTIACAGGIDEIRFLRLYAEALRRHADDRAIVAGLVKLVHDRTRASRCVREDLLDD